MSFDAPQLTKRMATTGAAFNEHSKDLLAVGYGDTSMSKASNSGLILFWSLKNPSYPERVIKTESGVSSLGFSHSHHKRAHFVSMNLLYEIYIWYKSI